MYMVPMEIPKNCNACPFGHCTYNHPFWAGKHISEIDGEEDQVGTFGYVCNVEFQESGRYTKVMRAEIGKDIPRPDWCQLQEVEKA